MTKLLSKSAHEEIKNIKNMEFRIYHDLTHFPYRNKKCLNDILYEIKQLI
jgi:hypothetical protein